MVKKIDFPLVLGVVSVLAVIASEYISAWVHFDIKTSELFDPTAWAAFGTMVLAGFAIAQWYLSVRTARRQLRAYLSIGARRTKFSNLLTFVCEAKLKNCGQTPAYFVADRYDVFVSKFPGPSVQALFGFDSEKQYRSSLGPGEETFLWEESELTEEELRGIESGELIIWFIGEVKYKDAFGKNHFLQFKSYFTKDDIANSSDERMNIAEDGNEEE